MRHVFLTGATGVLGSSLVPELLRNGDDVLHLLIRPNKTHTVDMRLQDLIDFWKDAFLPEWRQRIFLYAGDAAKDKFGLTESEYGTLLANVTHIVHSAAAVKLDMSEQEAEVAVYKPSKNSLTFAIELHRAGRLRKMEYISTLGVAGKLRGVVTESELPERAFHNTYESTKARAEQEVLLAYRQINLPVTIHRPSMIIGDSVTGKVIRFQGFYFLTRFLSGARTGGVMPDLPSISFDLISSDIVAKAICCSMNASEESVGRIFHLCSGPEHVVFYYDLIKSVRKHYARGSQRTPRLFFISPAIFVFLLRWVSFFSRDTRFKKAVRGLLLYFKHTDTVQPFSNVHTRDFMCTHGLDIGFKADHLDRALSYYINKVSEDQKKSQGSVS